MGIIRMNGVGMIYEQQMRASQLSLGRKNIQEDEIARIAPAKHATLVPYMAQIERRRKQKRRNRLNSKTKLDEQSSRSFRIKDRSTSSLQKATLERSKEGILIPKSKIKPLQTQLVREKKTYSLDTRFQPTMFRTVESNRQQSINGFFTETQHQAKQKPKNFRKNLYEAVSQTTIDRSITPAMTDKLNTPRDFVNGNINIVTGSIDARTQVATNKRQNFRRNQFEVASALECKSYDPHHKDLASLPLKKESNFQINRQMDEFAQKQIDRFHKHIRAKEIVKSVQKSTEKYLRGDGYRQTKSRNDIESKLIENSVYVSSVMNPSLNKVSTSTAAPRTSIEPSKPQAARKDLLDYEFDFPPQEGSVYDSHQQRTIRGFEDQRRQAQAQFFHREQPELEWSSQN